MKLFLDSSTLLAASGSATGASRLLVKEASARGWHLLSSIYCFEEARRNLDKVGPKAVRDFAAIIAPRIEFAPTAVVTDRPLVYPIVKDRPVLVSALTHECHALLTLDRADFQKLLGIQVYGMLICTPGDWLRSQEK